MKESALVREVVRGEKIRILGWIRAASVGGWLVAIGWW